MRAPFVWTRPSRTSLRVLCACCALWCAPAAALAAPEKITATPAVSTPASAATATANDSTARAGGVWFDRRVLALLAIGCVVGLIARRAKGGSPEIRFRLFNKPKKTPLSVLVTPGPAPRLIPSESPKATRARSARAPVPRQAPAGAMRSGVIDYIAAFSDSAEGSERARVDYLLVSDDDSASESPDSPDGSDGPPRDKE
jgi:hypothetical protein